MHYSKINTNVHYIRKKDNQDLIKKNIYIKKKKIALAGGDMLQELVIDFL